MQAGGVLASGFQSILREWADYAQSAVQRNVDGVNSLMRARTVQDLASAQSDLLDRNFGFCWTAASGSPRRPPTSPGMSPRASVSGRSSGTRRTPDGVFRWGSEQAAPMGEWPITTDNASE